MPVNSIEDIWGKICEECKKNISPLAFDTFFKFLQPQAFNSEEFYIVANNEYMKETVETLYKSIIAEAIKNVMGIALTPSFVILEEEEKIKKVEESSEGLTFEDFFTFDNFIVGSTNEFAYSVSMAVAKSDKTKFNPLVIYGPSGVGKTHLILAIKNYIKKNAPYKKVLYLRCEEFTNKLIFSLKPDVTGNNRMEEFRNTFRNVDVLIIDDIHFIAGKEQTQEEFFNTFNVLYQSGKQIIVTLDRPLREIKTLDDRIRSRLSGGLFADIIPPDFETRVGIIRKKCEQVNIRLEENLTFFIAEHIKENTRQLEGVIKKLEAYVHIQNKTPNITVIQGFIHDVINEDMPEPIKIETIISEVARTYNVSEKDILSSRRTANLALARQVAMYIAKEITDYSFDVIGKSFNKDHSTVLYNVKRIKQFLEDKPYEKELVEDIIKNIKGKTY